MNNYTKEFKVKISQRKIKIAVVGLGYVGLPLAIEFAKKGFEVIGVDADLDRVERFKQKKSYITDISTKELSRAIASKRISAHNDHGVLKAADAIFICVPTPLKTKYTPDISFIKSAVKAIIGNIKKGALVILESTTYPGTTEEVILKMFEAGGLKHGRDFYLSFSPERIDPGNINFPVHKIPKVVGGVSPEATSLTVELYRSIIKKVIPVSSPRVAETVKLLENTFRIVNIALIDEIAMMAHKMNLDIWEIVEAAATKPFGFMPFYPGPGVGGHCLDKNETVFVKDANSLEVMQMPEFIKHIENAKGNDVEVLSFDPINKKSVFKKVEAVSVRPYAGEMIDISTEDGRRLKVTDLHPMFIYDGSSWQLKYAKDLLRGDSLPVFLGLPEFSETGQKTLEVDIIEQIWKKGVSLIDKVRVKPIGFSFKDTYAREIKAILRRQSNKIPDACWEYLSNNILPLKYFYALDEVVNIDHRKLKLVTGRGPSYSEIPAVIEIDEDFCRLIGYYLSEGCYTKDKSARIRFTFNRSEKEYISDVIDILASLGIRSSIYESKKDYASCIKVSSNLFGFLIYEVLGCGSNCYNMSIPQLTFSLDRNKKMALLSGIFRGDACVEHFFGKWRYRRNEKEYLHNVNTAHISFYTSSKKLFHQLIVILHDLDIIPTFGKRKYTISIYGYGQLTLCKDLFSGKKKQILETYLKWNKNRPRNKTFQRFPNFATVRIKNISVTKGDWVYSLETAKPHTFVTSYGIVVHNCIPKDPLYLYWKARHYGFKSRFIKLASEIITYMPAYVVERISSILKDKGIALKKAKILILGVTYKKDILDLRKSPALDIIEILEKKNIYVRYHDPIIPYLKLGPLDLKSVKLSAEELRKFDCVVIVTDHTGVDYGLVLKNSQTIFDTRNAYKNQKSRKIFKL